MAYTSGFRRERSRRRRQFIGRASMFLLVVAGLAALGYSAYQSGTVLAESRVSELVRKAGELGTQLDGARADIARLEGSLAEARNAMQALQQRYDKDVPKGDIADLLGIARDRLGQGVPADRLAQVLRNATATRPCEARSIRRRFAIQQPGRPPEDPAVLLDGLVQVSASQPASSADARAVAVTVALAWANEPLKLTGLPARQDILINNAVLRLAVEASDLAGYATATLSVCGKG